MEAFRKEALSLATAPGAPPAFTGAEERAVFEDVLLYNVADSDPERYINEFGTLAAWADSSLDMYKVCYGPAVLVFPCMQMLCRAHAPALGLFSRGLWQAFSDNLDCALPASAL